ncbi:MAG: dTDP-4-dehydrorhamnose 3,5-epimerase [Verrucomicrobia bacterium]|nr:dTDP-4-dehydrorhamnose 3,5-epimerase [Verrucomicrobiota bacterium]
MEVVELSLSGLKLVRPKVFSDARGFFRETYRQPLYEKAGINCAFVQDNHSYSKKGTIRGMHFQRSPGQDKLISVVAGTIFDVAVDIRPESPTFGNWEGVMLDGTKGEQLFIPRGFAHGFCVVSDEAHLLYKVSSLYDPKEEMAFAFDDLDVNIDWPVSQPIVSERDRSSPRFKEIFQ